MGFGTTHDRGRPGGGPGVASWSAADAALNTTYANSTINSIISAWTPPISNPTAAIQNMVDTHFGFNGNETWTP
jgi:hypothetical protein